MTEDYLQRILKARVYDVAIESPLDAAPRLSSRLGNRILLKREDLQSVFSFKLRGAYNKIAHLSPAIAARGVICASAGNHAQGVALAARHRGIPAVVVMPRTTPAIKVQAVIELGAEIVLQGDVYDAAYEHALMIAAERHLVFVHPFDDADGSRPPDGWRARCRVRAGWRRRTDCRHRRLYQATLPAGQDHRRGAGGFRSHVRIAAGRQARHARAGRPVRRRGRGAPRRRTGLRAGAALCR